MGLCRDLRVWGLLRAEGLGLSKIWGSGLLQIQIGLALV